MSDDLIREIIGALFLAGAVYGGIRADLKAIHHRLFLLEQSLSRAHERLDDHLEKGRA
jgi:hypothetical protein